MWPNHFQNLQIDSSTKLLIHGIQCRHFETWYNSNYHVISDELYMLLLWGPNSTRDTKEFESVEKKNRQNNITNNSQQKPLVMRGEW